MGELKSLCPSARVDSIALGGVIIPALRVEFPGATIWAMESKYDAYTDTMHDAERPDFWAAEGDSLRFASGELIPHTAGGLRAFDSVGVVNIDHADDTDGTTIVICRFPQFSAAFGNMFLFSKKPGIVPLSRISARDTTTFWRMEFTPDRDDPSVGHCPSKTPHAGT